MNITDNKYQFLFPFEKVKAGSDILIYGAGIVGMEYLQQLLMTKYCNVVAMIDANAKEYSSMIMPVYEPQNVHSLKFDQVVVALRGIYYYDEIKRTLLEQGVEEENIIFVQRGSNKYELTVDKKIGQREYCFAYEEDSVSMAILLSGGLGDLVVSKKVVVELTKYVTDCKIDLYYTNHGEFIKYIYSDCENINQIIPDLGMQYKNHYRKYDLSIDIYNWRYIHVDFFKAETFEGKFNNVKEKIEILISESESEKFDRNTSAHTVFQTRIYKGLNVYTAYNYNGAFQLDDKRVNIPIDSSVQREFEELNLSKYITINGTSGACKDSKIISKAWPEKYVKEFVTLFKKKYPHIAVVQLGEEGVEEIKEADFCLLGKKFELLVHVLKNSILHVDIESGLAHIASQIGTKCAVLFGPTLVEYFAYENNINIVAGQCGGCFGLQGTAYKCVRNMDEPECMYSIKPELVMEKIQNCIEEYYVTYT